MQWGKSVRDVFIMTKIVHWKARAFFVRPGRASRAGIWSTRHCDSHPHQVQVLPAVCFTILKDAIAKSDDPFPTTFCHAASPLSASSLAQRR